MDPKFAKLYQAVTQLARQIEPYGEDALTDEKLPPPAVISQFISGVGRIQTLAKPDVEYGEWTANKLRSARQFLERAKANGDYDAFHTGSAVIHTVYQVLTKQANRTRAVLKAARKRGLL